MCARLAGPGLRSLQDGAAARTGHTNSSACAYLQQDLGCDVDTVPFRCYRLCWRARPPRTAFSANVGTTPCCPV